MLIATTSNAPINTGGAGNGTAVSRHTTPIVNASASPIAIFIGDTCSSIPLQLCFDEPQLFVGFTGNFGEDVRRIGVAELRRIVACRAYRCAECTQPIPHACHMPHS